MNLLVFNVSLALNLLAAGAMLWRNVAVALFPPLVPIALALCLVVATYCGVVTS